jgi:hypothetical protein
MVSAPVRDADRRVVAIALDAVDCSARIGSGSATGKLRPGRCAARRRGSARRVRGADSEDDPDDWVQDDEVVDEVETATAALGHPDLVVHRLAFDARWARGRGRPRAALSELIGFDPDRGCTASRPRHPSDGVLVRAPARIAA